MELEDALYRFAATQAPLVAILGEANRLRFFKLAIPKGSKFPALVQQRSGAPRSYSQCGTKDGAVSVSMQIDAYATSWAAMAALAKAWRVALNPKPSPYPLQMGTGNSPDDSVRVKGAILENENDLDDPEPGLFRRTQLWTIWVYEP